jgi:uncharacterized phage protein gp47/JayE
MACTILRPDPQTLFNHLRDAFSSTVLGGGKVIPESNEWYVVANDYAIAEEFYAIADQLWRENNPETACCENLYKIAAQHGVFPKPAAHAEGYAKLFGTPGSNVPPSFEVQTDKGIYVSVGTVPLKIGSSGEVIVRVRSLAPGSEFNAANEAHIGVLVTPAPGIEPEVHICGGNMCGGTAEEDCEAFRKRYLERLAYYPRATQAWLKQKIMEWPCVSHVCVREGSCCRCEAECGDCACKNCGNRMEFYALFHGSFFCGVPPQYIVDDMNDWLFGVHQGYGEGQVEIGVCGKIYVPRPLGVDVHIDIEGCPTTGQKQMIEDDIRALFQRICPSMPLRVKQIELIVAAIIGTDMSSSVYFSVVGFEDYNPPYPRELVLITPECFDLEPECDVLPCINQVIFTDPQSRPPCASLPENLVPAP